MYTSKVFPDLFSTLNEQHARAMLTHAGIRNGHGSGLVSSILAPAKAKLKAADLQLSNHIWSFETHENEERDGDRGKIEDNIDKAMVEVGLRKAVVNTLEMAVLRALQAMDEDGRSR